MSDQKQVVQETIKFFRQGDGPFRVIREYQVPEPPLECESQQVMDWAVVVVCMATGMDMTGKMRVVSAYAERWHIPTEDVDKSFKDQ